MHLSIITRNAGIKFTILDAYGKLIVYLDLFNSADHFFVFRDDSVAAPQYRQGTECLEAIFQSPEFLLREFQTMNLSLYPATTHFIYSLPFSL